MDSVKPKKALIVITKSGKKGYVYYNNNKDLSAEKVQVHIIDKNHQETGEKLLCKTKSLTATGYKD